MEIMLCHQVYSMFTFTENYLYNKYVKSHFEQLLINYHGFTKVGDLPMHINQTANTELSVSKLD